MHYYLFAQLTLFPHIQVTVAILLNSFVSAIAATEEEADQAAYASLKSRDLLR